MHTGNGNRRRLTVVLAMCLAVGMTACGGKGKGSQKAKPYSPIDGDTVSVIIEEYRLRTLDEAMDEAFGDEKSQDSLNRELRRAIKKKYKHMGDSLLRELLRGEKIH